MKLREHCTDRERALRLAKRIVHLDLVRDAMWEKLQAVAGPRGHELLRNVQNGWFERGEDRDGSTRTPQGKDLPSL